MTSATVILRPFADSDIDLVLRAGQDEYIPLVTTILAHGDRDDARAFGVIHTDFEKGFIKAEVISFADLVETGSVVEARSTGKARLECKGYIMQDRDVVEFRFSN